MSQLKVNGTSADYMMNIFVTKTFPNHHTMATGLYAETHGVVDNEYYEPVTENVTKYSYKLYHYDNSILPIWVSRDILSLSYLAILILSFMIYDL
jgi:ectonucleotide pyrophosphatase/phosphodiesterase family protein 5